MEIVFIIVVGILILLAITDLIVGVSNDAVNFLVPAVGSKVAPFKIIMIIAGLGILIGATFSNGMMEIARKGIFHPELFSFNSIMIIFLAVMLTDVIMLDIFNTLGLPTSTTVSIVFELLGAAVAVAIMIISKDTENSHHLFEYINTASALKIITGILLSIAVAFTVGAIIQYLTRLLFTFDYSKTFKYFGAIWAGMAITAITYFILIKGLKTSGFAGKGTTVYNYVHENTELILIYSFIGWSVILAIFQFFFKFNILKFVVLAGTFSLAMAFAGNDLVNFIGVPLAGLASLKDWIANGSHNQGFLMTSLSEPVSTPTLFLLIAGTVMVLTMWISKKAKTVTQTSVNLSRQDEGKERFDSTVASRALVRASVLTSKFFSSVTPKIIKKLIEKRFDTSKIKEKNQSFDLIRAGVNLMVSGILISIGTSYKLPLSTTYVTFMVAMGTSLADKAWGRESAVYRVSGVITVISGWFLTAFVAFTVAFVFAIIMFNGSIYIGGIILLLVSFSLYKSYLSHKKKEIQKTNEKIDEDEINSNCKLNIINILSSVSDIYERTIDLFAKEKRNKLKKIYLVQKKLSKKTKKLKDNIFITINQFQESKIDAVPYYVQVLDYLRELTHALHFIVKPTFDHLDNNHKPLIKDQYSELSILSQKTVELINTITDSVKNENFENTENIIEIQQDLTETINKYRIKQIKRIKNKEIGTKNSILYMDILTETKNIALYIVNLYKSQRDFNSVQNKT